MSINIYPDTTDAADPASRDFAIDAICNDIHEACKVYGLDEKRLIRALGSATPEQRMKIAKRYNELYERSLKAVIKMNCAGDFGTALQLLALPPNVAEAKLIKRAFRNFRTSEKYLYPIFCGRSNAEMSVLKQTYFETYGQDLGEVVESGLKGDFQALMAACVEGAEETYNDQRHTNEKARSDAEDINIASLGKFGTDKRTIFNILCASPPQHLEAVNVAYAEKYEVEMREAIDKELSGTAKKAALFVVGMKLSPYETIAQLIKSAHTGIGTDELLLSACLVRYQLVMGDVMSAHMRLFEKSIKDRVESKTKGLHKRLLLKLLDTAPVKQGSTYSLQPKEQKFGRTSENDTSVGVSGEQGEAGKSTESTEMTTAQKESSSATVRTNADSTLSINTFSDVSNNHDTSPDFVRTNSMGTEQSERTSTTAGSQTASSMSINIYPRVVRKISLSEDFGPEINDMCKDIYGACKGWHSADEKQKLLIEALGSATPEQRTKVSISFEEMFEMKLTTFIKDEFSGDFGTALLLLALPPNVAEARLIKMAFGSFGTAEKYLYPIICGRSNEEMSILKRTYFETYEQDLGELVDSGLKGDFQALMTACIEGAEKTYDTRHHTNEEANSDAVDIYVASLGKFGSDKTTVFKVLCASPPQHLEAVNVAYTEKYGMNLYEVLAKALSGMAKKAALFLVGMKLSPYKTIAQLIKSACTGIGTDEFLLSACLVRYQLVMEDVMTAYMQLFGKSLKDKVDNRARGIYKILLLKMLNSTAHQPRDNRPFQPQFVQTVRVNIPPGMVPGEKLEVQISTNSTETHVVTIPKRYRWHLDSEGQGEMFFIEHITGNIITLAV